MAKQVYKVVKRLRDGSRVSVSYDYGKRGNELFATYPEGEVVEGEYPLLCFGSGYIAEIFAMNEAIYDDWHCLARASQVKAVEAWRAEAHGEVRQARFVAAVNVMTRGALSFFWGEVGVDNPVNREAPERGYTVIAAPDSTLAVDGIKLVEKVHEFKYRDLAKEKANE